jgi:hypothetical protein
LMNVVANTYTHKQILSLSQRAIAVNPSCYSKKNRWSFEAAKGTGMFFFK